MKRLQWAVACGAFAAICVLLARPSEALQAATRCSNLPGGLGIADGIPGDLEDRIDAGGVGDPAGTPLVNDVKTDDALACVMGHIIESPSLFLGDASDVDTYAEWLAELANTASHEIGHLFSLLHADDIGDDDLMDGDYDGTNKGFGATSVGGLDGLAAETQVVWVDFEAASTELHPSLDGLSDAPQFAAFGKNTAADKTAAKTTIFNAMVADYNNENAYANGFKVDLVTTKPTSGDFSTLSFVVPEPATATLLALGLLGMGFARTRRAR